MRDYAEAQVKLDDGPIRRLGDLAENPTLMRLRELEVLQNVAGTGKLDVMADS
jgi:hypothetical protein